MIQVLSKKHNLICLLEKKMNEVEVMPSNKAYLIKKVVQEINTYSENILLLYEDKIIIDRDLQKEAKAAMQLTINNLIEELQGAEFSKWVTVFPIANSIIELYYELNKLERFVRNKEIKETKTTKKANSL